MKAAALTYFYSVVQDAADAISLPEAQHSLSAKQWQQAGDSIGKSLYATMRAGHTVIPLGSASCPFWLNISEQLLLLVIRVADLDGAEKKPALFYPQDQVERGKIAEAGAMAHYSTTRMLVTRFADQAVPSTKKGDRRELGFHYLAFKCGDWEHFIPCGLNILSDDAEVGESAIRDMQARLGDNPLVRFLKEEIGNPPAMARRTLDYIDLAANFESDWLDEVEKWMLQEMKIAASKLDVSSGAEHSQKSLSPYLNFYSASKFHLLSCSKKG